MLWHPKGGIVRHLIESYWKEKHLAAGYSLVNTPHVAKLDLWKTSGHFDFYAENMFDQMEVGRVLSCNEGPPLAFPNFLTPPPVPISSACLKSMCHKQQMQGLGMTAEHSIPGASFAAPWHAAKSKCIAYLSRSNIRFTVCRMDVFMPAWTSDFRRMKCTTFVSSFLSAVYGGTNTR